MNVFFTEHQILLKAFVKHQVNFLLIGGYAVILHGYPRTTGDMDIWIEPSNKNKAKFINALTELDYNKEDLKQLSKMDFESHLVFSIGAPPKQMDFLTHVNQVDFPLAYQNKIDLEVDDLIIPVVNLNHLVLMKMNTGRAKDKADIEELNKINKNK